MRSCGARWTGHDASEARREPKASEARAPARAREARSEPQASEARAPARAREACSEPRASEVGEGRLSRRPSARMSESRPRIVLVSGLSGSGKSTAMSALEDLAYYCVDNLPVQLIDRFLGLCRKTTPPIEKIALPSDAREAPSLGDRRRGFAACRAPAAPWGGSSP